MAEYLVKENAGSASGEDGRAEKRLGNRCMQESCEVSGHPVNGGKNRVVAGQARRVCGVERRRGSQVHSVRRAPFRRNRQPHEVAPILQPAAFRVHQVLGFPLRRQTHVRGEDLRELAEYQRQSAQAIHPGLYRYGHCRGCLAVYLGRLHGKIVRRIFGRDLHLLVAANLDESFGCFTIGAIGFEPQGLLDGDGDVVEADQRSRRKLCPFAANPVIIVQLGAAHPQRNIHVPCPATAVVRNRSQGRRYAVKFLVCNFITDEIRRWVSFFLQNPKVTVEFFTQNLKNRGLGKRCGEKKDEKGRPGQNSHSGSR